MTRRERARDMNGNGSVTMLDMARLMFQRVVTEQELLAASVSVLAKTLTHEETIGRPNRRDYPLATGKERVLQAVVAGAKAHVHVDFPCTFAGSLQDVLALPLTSNRARAIFIATVNGVLKSLNVIGDTLHCRDDEPEKCAKEMASALLEQYGKIKVGLVGVNPSIAENVVETFGPQNVNITESKFDPVERLKSGVTVWNGRSESEEFIASSDVILITDTTLVSGTFDRIWMALQDPEKQYFMCGITGSGICEFMGFNRWCPYGRS